MTIREMVRAAAELVDIRVQLLNECVLNARVVKRKKDQPQHSVVSFATENMTPDDLFWLACEPKERSFQRKPRFVGVVVWIPSDDYEQMAASSPKEKA